MQGSPGSGQINQSIAGDIAKDIVGEIDSFLRNSRYRMALNLENVRIAAANPSVLVTAIPFVENLRVNRALDTLSSIPEGKALVDQARAASVSIGLDANPYARGGRFSGDNSVREGSYIRTPRDIVTHGYSTHGVVVQQMAHELRHAAQAGADRITGFNDRVLSPVEAIWHNRFIEADAEATAVDIAWKLKQAGKPDAWNAMSKGNASFPGVAAAYEKIALTDPHAQINGQAKRAAFDAWFSSAWKNGVKVSDVYNKQAIDTYPDAEDVKKMVAHGRPLGGLSVGELQKLGTLDGGSVNYLDIPGAKPLDSPHYRDGMPVFTQDMRRLVGLQEKFNAIKSTHEAAAGKAVGRGDIALSLAEGNYGAAAASAAMNAEVVGQSAGYLSKFAPILAKGALQVAKRTPVIGAVFTAGFVAAEVGKNLLQGETGKAGAAALAGGAEIAGNAAGFGVGDAVREAVRGGIIAAAGEDYAVDKSGLRSMGERTVDVTGKFFKNPASDRTSVSPPAADVRPKPPSP